MFLPQEPVLPRRSGKKKLNICFIIAKTVIFPHLSRSGQAEGGRDERAQDAKCRIQPQLRPGAAEVGIKTGKFPNKLILNSIKKLQGGPLRRHGGPGVPGGGGRQPGNGNKFRFFLSENLLKTMLIFFIFLFSSPSLASALGARR